MWPWLLMPTGHLSSRRACASAGSHPLKDPESSAKAQPLSLPARLVTCCHGNCPAKPLALNAGGRVPGRRQGICWAPLSRQRRHHGLPEPTAGRGVCCCRVFPCMCVCVCARARFAQARAVSPTPGMGIPSWIKNCSIVKTVTH